jgi:hypothetical protein
MVFIGDSGIIFLEKDIPRKDSLLIMNGIMKRLLDYKKKEKFKKILRKLIEKNFNHFFFYDINYFFKIIKLIFFFTIKYSFFILINL